MKHMLATIALGSAFLSPSGIAALAAPFVLPTSVVVPAPSPEPQPEPAFRYDASRAVAAGRIQAGGDTTPLRGDVVDNEDGTLTLYIRDFYTGLGHNDGLSSRLNLRAAIPVETLEGAYPASLEAISELRVDKAAGSDVAAALDVSVLSLVSDESTLRWPLSQRVAAKATLRNFVSFENDAAKKEGFCAPGMGKGLLLVNFAVSAVRENAHAGVFSVRPAEGRDLSITVKPGAAKACD
jgi:hypothetical protein